MANNYDFHAETKAWRNLFPSDLLTKGERIRSKDQVRSFRCEGRRAGALLPTRPGQEYHASVENAPDSYFDEWSDALFSCDCGTKRTVTVQSGKQCRYLQLCQHEAALLLFWEEVHGPWHFPEPEELREARERAEREAREERERAMRREEEKRRLRQEKTRLEKQRLPALEFLGDRIPEGTFFDLREALSGVMTNRYAVRQAAAMLEAGAVSLEPPRLSYGELGEQRLSAVGEAEDAFARRQVRIELYPEELGVCRCGCRTSYSFLFDNTLCEHELALLALAADYVGSHDPGDATDRAADSFFRVFDASADEAREAEQAPERSRNVVLSPRLTLDGEEAEISYRAGLQGGKLMLLRSLREFVQAADGRKTFPLSKSITLDFSASDFTEDSLPWLDFLRWRLREADALNEMVAQRSRYYSVNLALKARETLSGAMLDRFYTLAEGCGCDYQNKSLRTEGRLPVGKARVHITLSSRRLADGRGGFRGIELTGRMPRMLRGGSDSYLLSEEGLSRVTPEEEQALRPFRAAADGEGNIRFRVGREKLSEFYYRVVPRLAESPYVELVDGCAEEAEALLPPEPAFVFRLDMEEDEGLLLCGVLVSYGSGETPLTPEPEGSGQERDAAQEERVLKLVRRFFPSFREESRQFTAPYTEDTLYSLLTEGLPALSRYGELRATDAFGRSYVRPMPAVQVGVSVESGLLEIELLTKDMEPEELLAVLESYRQKKKYHRLRGGAFIRLEGDQELSALEHLTDALDLDAAAAVQGGARLPAYRALYLDSLLERHDALVSNRDRSYRALVKNFKTIRDAEYEVPDAQAGTLRPYQVYGYKWLRTLTAAGFGGILADEMGLGKTLQFISLLQALRDSGECERCLVVCPASLVYNWQEEFSRFAPGLDVRVAAGTAAQRSKRLREAVEEQADAVITSYDLLRQDIAQYAELRFSLMVLDEAQYIKNQKAALTKAVKAVRAEHRFALTGTPIENRLAELWSIFDFLMPGFLYGYTEFSRRFETPVTRQKDPRATEALKRMTSPFILRRLKAEVLKDLPPKLEEVRFTRFEEEQRKVYDGQVVRMKQLLLSSGSGGQDRLMIFAELTRIRQLCCDPSLLLEDYRGGSAKRAACLELVRSAMAGGHRMLVFSQFTSMLSLLEEDLHGEGIPYFKLTGATPKEQRTRLVREFNEGGVPVFLISLKAGGTGLNLTGADVVIHYDPWWNLAAQNQATDRAHRIGQQNAVTVYRLIVKDTIEEKILALQEAKRDLADAILSGESTSITALSNEELLALLET